VTIPLQSDAVQAVPSSSANLLIDPVFRADSVVLAISAEKDGNLRVVYARIGRCQGRPAWRGAQAAVARPYPAVTCHVGVNGGLYVFEPPAGGHRYTSRAAPAEPEVVKDLAAVKSSTPRRRLP
jgi:hypothetical protein